MNCESFNSKVNTKSLQLLAVESSRNKYKSLRLKDSNLANLFDLLVKFSLLQLYGGLTTNCVKVLLYFVENFTWFHICLVISFLDKIVFIYSFLTLILSSHELVMGSLI
jgi:hypothetical protein